MQDWSGDIVAFCWSAPEIVAAATELAKELRKRHQLRTTFVVDMPDGKFQFLCAGQRAFTMHELIAALPGATAELSASEAEWATDFDRKVNRSNFARPETLTAAYGVALDALGAGCAFTWNGSYSIQRCLALAAKRRNLPCFFLERGLLPGKLVVDPIGVNYGSHLAGPRWADIDHGLYEDDERRAELFCRRLVESQQTVVGRGKQAASGDVRKDLDIPEHARVVLFPLQIEVDSNIVLYSPVYKDMLTALTDVQEALAPYEDIYLIVKPHPESKTTFDELKSICGPRTRLTTDYNVRSLLGLTSAVVVINSTVGIEAMTEGKPVVALGNASYTQKKCTFDLSEFDSLQDCIDAALSHSEMPPERRRAFHEFLVYLLRNCLFELGENDEWGSRERITGMMAAAYRSNSKTGHAAVKALEAVGNETERVIAYLESLHTGEKSILLFGGLQEAASLFKRVAPNARMQQVRLPLRWKEIASTPLHRFDAAFLLSSRPSARRYFQTFVRATKKFELY